MPRIAQYGLSCALVLAAVAAHPVGVAAQQALPTGVELAARGPVHEAFAQPAQLVPPVPPAVPQQPPSPITEEPPSLRPEGNDILWIPGYWAWESQRKDFLWVSGVWRRPPPGQTYVAGYWARTGDSCRRASGFWIDARRADLAYLPEPPTPQETGPSGPAPDGESVFVPGHWAYRNNQYTWRPGTWVVLRPGMVWVPAHFAWSPAGYVFINGYWDYPLARRGLLFAPISFNQPVWRKAGWVHRPAHVIQAGALLNSLFVEPASTSYLYGNYANVGSAGSYVPWNQYGPNRFDPLYTFYSFQNRNNANWVTHLNQVYAERGAGKVEAKGPALVKPLAKSATKAMKLTAVNAAQRKTYLATAGRFHEATAERMKGEAREAPRAGSPGHSLKLATIAHGGAKGAAARPLPPPAVRRTEPSHLSTKGGSDTRTKTASETKTKGGSETKTKTASETKSKGGKNETKSKSSSETKSKGGKNETKSKSSSETKSKGGKNETKSKSSSETKSKGGKNETKSKSSSETKSKGGKNETKSKSSSETKSKGGKSETKSKSSSETKSKGGKTDTKTKSKSETKTKGDKKEKGHALAPPDGRGTVPTLFAHDGQGHGAGFDPGGMSLGAEADWRRISGRAGAGGAIWPGEWECLRGKERPEPDGRPFDSA